MFRLYSDQTAEKRKAFELTDVETLRKMIDLAHEHLNIKQNTLIEFVNEFKTDAEKQIVVDTLLVKRSTVSLYLSI